MTSQQSALLISIIGILNTVSRVLVGWVADRPWADALLLNSVALVIGGVSTMFVPYYSNFGTMATYSVVFGVAIGRVLGNQKYLAVFLPLPFAESLCIYLNKTHKVHAYGTFDIENFNIKSHNLCLTICVVNQNSL